MRSPSPEHVLMLVEDRDVWYHLGELHYVATPALIYLYRSGARQLPRYHSQALRVLRQLKRVSSARRVSERCPCYHSTCSSSLQTHCASVFYAAPTYARRTDKARPARPHPHSQGVVLLQFVVSA